MADYFKWDDNQYGLKIQKMDDEHKVLIDIMNRLHHKWKAKAPKQEILGLVKELGKYTVEHFNDEEKFMASIGYPDLDKHKAIHKSLLSRYGGFQKSFEEGLGEMPEDFFQFLRLWLQSHIKGIDMKYSNYGRETGKVA